MRLDQDQVEVTIASCGVVEANQRRTELQGVACLHYKLIKRITLDDCCMNMCKLNAMFFFLKRMYRCVGIHFM